MWGLLSEQEFIQLLAKAEQTNVTSVTAQPTAFLGTEAEKAAQTPGIFCISAALTKPHDGLSVCVYCSGHPGDLSVPVVLISGI